MSTHKPLMHFKVDASLCSVVAVCKVPGCKTRFVRGSKRAGLEALAEHGLTAHPDYENSAAHRLGKDRPAWTNKMMMRYGDGR